MKTLKRSILLVAIFATTLSNASDIYVANTAANKTSLTVSHVKAGHTVSIKDNNGITLYSEIIKAAGTYRKGFDLTALPSGEYYFEVDKDVEINTMPFTVAADEVVFLKDKETVTYKPYIRLKDNMLFVTKFAPEMEPLKISIYSDNNSEYELLYSEKIAGVKSIEKVYKLKKGDYRIVLSSNNKEYTKFINN